MEVFVSVGTGLNAQQEAFVCAVEERLRAVGLSPCTIGRNMFSTDAPLRAVADLMDRCAGVVVIAIERYRFVRGVERRGSDKERELGPVGLPTSWNQIEAAFAYSRGLPLLVIVDESLRCDGLLEKGNDWYVHEQPVEPAALNSAAFVGLLGSWKERVLLQQQQSSKNNEHSALPDPASMTVGQLIGILKPAQLWAALIGIAGATGGAFALRAKLAS